VDPALADAALRELDNCDFGRFAPAGAQREELAAAFGRTRDLVRRLEAAS
jgi:hypothetical protein